LKAIIRSEYEVIHKKSGFTEEKEYYALIGSLLKGSKSVDIGCGYFFIQKFSPETIGVDFSINALKTARDHGGKFLVLASAENMPFKENAFDVSSSLGVLEHIVDQFQAINEMSRISKVQILIVHTTLPYVVRWLKPIVFRLFKLKDQPLERALSSKEIKSMVKSAGLRVMMEGIWNYIDLRWLWRKIPYGIIKIPSHYFLVCIKTDNLERKFLGDI